jgi:exopolysaccharide biosynthesis polyprenyl glycosylphosphotransferase
MHVVRHSVLPGRLSERRGLKRELIFGALLVVLDVLTFAGAYLQLLQTRDAEAPYLWPLAICLSSIGVVFMASNRYSLRTDMNSVRFAAEHALSCSAAFALSLLLQFAIFSDFDLSRSRLALLAAFVLFTPVSLVFRRLIGRSFRVRAETQSFLVIGAGPSAISFYRACRENEMAQTLRFVDLSGTRAGEHLDGPASPWIEWGHTDDFTLLLDGSVEAIVLAEPFPSLPAASIPAMIRTHFYHAPILTLEAFYEQYWKKIPVVTMDPLWALRQDFRLARDSSYRFFKRAFDVVVAVLGLIFTLPLLLACAVALVVEGSPPIFYAQERVRRDRQRFMLYKFRTMRVSWSETELYTRDEDTRVTGVGRWLRRMRLDELPQLWNVLKGDMSLIGPRAEWSRCVEVYEREIPCYHFRHLVKPGITGWAQVNYPYGQSVDDTIEKLKYDLYYIKNYSFLLDASIVLKTLYVILSFKGK